MPCQINTIQFNDPTLQQLFARIEDAISLSALVFAGWQFALRLTVLLIEETLQTRAKRPTHWPNCPMCGKRLQSKGFVPRQITTLIGMVRFKRRVGRCPNRCRIGQQAPLDDELALTARQRSDLGLKRVACLLAVFVPYETAQVLLSQLICIQICKDTIWEWVADAGQRAMTALFTQLDALTHDKPPAVESMDAAIAQLPLLIGADGVMVPFRPKAGTPKGATRWREVKVALVARIRPRRTKRRHDDPPTETELAHRRLVACFGNIVAFIDELGQRLWLEALKQGITTATQVVWISDGARGFWRLFGAYFASVAIGILDFYHAAQNVFKVATTWLDGRTKRARYWFAAARHQLRHGPSMGLRMKIERALKDPSLCADSRKALSNLMGYLDTLGFRMGR